MKIRTCFILCNYLLAALALSALALSEIFPLPVNLVFLAALSFCGFLESKKIIPLTAPKRLPLWKSGFVFLPFVLYFFDFQVLDLLVIFLILVLFTRIIYKTELNDYLYGYLIAIVCLLVGAIYIADFIFGVLFLSFYLVLCWALIFYNLMVERVGSNCPPELFKRIGGGETVGVPLFGVSSGLMFLSLLLTAVIFISFPRLGLGFLSLNSNAPPMSGFSEKVTLGDVGKIKLNQEVVMRVEFTRNGVPFRPGAGVLWRGVALDRYDGKAWFSTSDSDWEAENKAGAGVDLFPMTFSGQIVRQEVYMEALDSEVVFTYGIPINIAGSFSRLEMDASFALRTGDTRIGPRKYLMISEIREPDASYPTAYPFSKGDDDLTRFLQIPEMSSQIILLGRRFAEGVDTPLEKAGRVLSYLQNGFSYSLEMVKETKESSLDEFLFHRKKGHCEYFASAMVILLRVAGVPARIVNGFMGAEWNEFGKYMVVRQQHAHSWVEAYIPGRGWTVFDPTPPDPTSSFAPRNSIILLIDLMRLNWQRYVIRYSLQDQIRLVNFFSQKGQSVARTLKIFKPGELKKALAALKESPWTLFTITALYLLYYFIKTRGVLLAFFSSQRPFAVVVYARMLRRLEQRGIRKAPSWTHREFLQHLSPLPPEKRDNAERIAAFYEKCRFAAFSPSDAEKQEMLRLIHRL